MPDTLRIHNLLASSRIGLTAQERKRPQRVWIDLEIEIDARRAAAADDVRRTVDYARLVALIRRHLRQRAVNLLETVAEDLARLVLRMSAAPRVRIEIRKRALAGIAYAAVSVSRRRGRRSKASSAVAPGSGG